MDAIPSLTEVLAEIPDPRCAAGRRYTLASVLNLMTVAMLAGQRSLTAIAQFARDHGTSLTHALDFTSASSPCTATLSNILQRLDADAFETALTRWILGRHPDYGITSLTPQVAAAACLLELNRTHWSIENNLHWVQDVVFGEDACRVHRGQSPQLVSALRNALTHLLADAKTSTVAAALRRFTIHPLEALTLLASLPITEN